MTTMYMNGKRSSTIAVSIFEAVAMGKSSDFRKTK
jgi:hypothetical protein